MDNSSIDFGGFKSALTGDADIALVDSGYNLSKSSILKNEKIIENILCKNQINKF